MASYAAIVDALKFAIEGGTAPKLTTLKYEPMAVQTSPLAYILFQRFRDVSQGQIEGRRYEIIVRVLVNWNDNEGAEIELMQFLPGGGNSIKRIVKADQSLGGVLSAGIAFVSEGEGIFVEIGGTKHRAVDFTVDVLDKSPDV